jgi:stalled ribosome rescue protein Dom34
MNKTGIWLDKKVAYVISDDLNGHQTMEVIFSKVEIFHVHGGSGTRRKGGPQDVVQDRRYLERENHQLKNYFKEIVGHIKDCDQVVIYGPAETGQKFKKELDQNYESLALLVSEVVITDSMSKNQMKALVRDYFTANSSGVNN